MLVKICFVSIDVEQDRGKEGFRGVEKLDEILNLFKKYKIPATLFVTGEVLERYSNSAKEWQRDYEVACHGFTHRFWNALSREERKKELEDFINLYQGIFQKKPLGFRAPSHVIDEEGLKLLGGEDFLYDSSIVPHYPPFKKYRGYRGRAPLTPYYPLELPKLLEIPVSGQLFGIPLAGAWVNKLPFWFYKVLFSLYCPSFITLSWHSWDGLKNLDNILNLLKNKNYQFLNGEQILKNYQQG